MRSRESDEFQQCIQRHHFHRHTLTHGGIRRTKTSRSQTEAEADSDSESEFERITNSSR